MSQPDRPSDATGHNAHGDGDPACHNVELTELLHEFYGGPAGFSQLAEFESVSSVPSPYDRLLDHNEHMTVTVEAFHNEEVDVDVHQCHVRNGWYSREITLKGVRSGHVVQYGIVRLDIKSLSDHVWREIESETTPLGRVLIKNNVLRTVQLCGLWRTKAGPCLATHLRVPIGTTVYGRTALIYCDGEPAIQLLEIVCDSPDSRP